jgi:hypothetical protein
VAQEKRADGLTDPRADFIKSIDISKARVDQFPGRYFFCGGQLAPSSDHPLSVRDYVLRWLKANDGAFAERVVLAEDINDWMDEGTYRELFTLEEHIAGLAYAIVIFLESPGSIAELGAFSALPGVRNKLLVFVQDTHFNSRSFIKRGPITFLQEDCDNSVVVYPWRTVTEGGLDRLVTTSVDDCIEEVHKDLKSVSVRTARRLDTSQHRDRMLLIAELVNVFVALRLSEVGDYLQQLEVDVPPDLLKKYLFVLRKLGLLKEVTRGESKNKYFLAKDENRFVTLPLRDSSKPVDRARLQFDVAEYYKAHDPARHKAFYIAAEEGGRAGT